MRFRPTLVPVAMLVIAGVLAMSADPSTALPQGKQNKIQNCENAIIDAQEDFFGTELAVFRTCAKQFVFANIKDSPAKETALAAAKLACKGQLETLDDASSAFVDTVISACTPAANLLFTKPSDPTGYQDLIEGLSQDSPNVANVDTVPELAAFLCANKTIFAVLLTAYEIPRGTQLFTTYVTNELHKTVTDFLDPRCSAAPKPPPKK